MTRCTRVVDTLVAAVSISLLHNKLIQLPITALFCCKYPCKSIISPSK